MRRRLQTTSLNMFVLGTSAGIFLLTFFVLQGYIQARIPEEQTILVAARPIQIGEKLGPNDFSEHTVYVDALTSQYITVHEAGSISGALTLLPIQQGQPLQHVQFINPERADVRFSAVLAQFPGHSLYPLPLDFSNITAPPIQFFQPGDLIGITIVIQSRPPQPSASPTPDNFVFTIPGAPPTDLLSVLPTPSPTEQIDTKGFPPLAKDLIPGGVRVVAVQGLPASAPDGDTQVYGTSTEREMIILLLPDDQREKLSLALEQGAHIFISLLDHTNLNRQTSGFTYWDFEDWFLEGRILITPTPEVRP